MSALLAGVRKAAGRPVRARDRRRHRPAKRAGHQPSGRRSFRKQRTVTPPMVPARYNFLHPSSRPARRVAACGGCPRPGQTTLARVPGVRKGVLAALGGMCDDITA
ncbi:MAG TPA: hypothetical protein VI036_15995 [Propionibacteriaceae bacterium]